MGAIATPARARGHILTWIAATMAVVVIAVTAAAAFIDEPLRRYLERRVNEQLDGYTVSIGDLDLHILGLALDLEEVSVVQDERPRPPVAYLPQWTTSIDWRALLSLAIVARTTFDRPEIFITREQAAVEASDPTPIADRGWQDALTAVYPLEINSLRILSGTVSYHEVGAQEAIELERMNVFAGNIRNVTSAAGEYPSPVALDCTVFGSGALEAKGHADFLARPYPTLQADFSLDGAPLARLAPVASQLGVTITGGELSAAGTMTRETAATRIALRRVLVQAPVLEYGVPAAQAAASAVEPPAEQSAFLRVDEFRVRGGTMTYRATDPLPPLRLERLDVLLTDFENRPAPRGRLPSRLEADCTVFETGTMRAEGRVDLLAPPGPLGLVRFALNRVELKRLAPLARQWGVDLEAGVLSVEGEAARDATQARLLVRRLVADRPVVEYVQRTAQDEARTERAAQKTTEAKDRPAVRVDLDRAEVRRGTFGFSDETSDPSYRLFLADTDVVLTGFSNQRSDRNGVAQVRGKFMNSGAASLDASFAGGGSGRPEFELAMRLERVDLTTLNDLLRGRAGVDVVAGRFWFYSDFRVRNGRLDGYVKPFFEDVDVYDRVQDASKPVGQKLYEALVGGAATALENPFRTRVATRADISGPIGSPDTSTWQIILGLLRNAFIQALRPGLEPQRAQ